MSATGRKWAGTSGLLMQAYPRETRDRVLDLLRSGYTQADVERMTGIADTTIHRWRMAELDPTAFAPPPAPNPMRIEQVLQAIEAAKAKRGWSWERLSEAAGLHPRRLWALRTGQIKHPQQAMLDAIGRALGLEKEEVQL